jgi:hypothetical protein
MKQKRTDIPNHPDYDYVFIKAKPDSQWAFGYYNPVTRMWSTTYGRNDIYISWTGETVYDWSYESPEAAKSSATGGGGGSILATPHEYIDPQQSKKGKLPYAMIPKEFIEELAKVVQVSIEKGYKPFNWRQKDSQTKLASYLVSAGLRHTYEWLAGNDLNEEKKSDGSTCDTRSNHLACAAYNFLMAVTLQCDGRTDLDDRFKVTELIK